MGMGRSMMMSATLVRLAVCFLVACMLTRLKLAAADNSDCHVLPFLGYFGGDIGQGVTVNNIYGCADRCHNNANCLAFSFGSDKACYIKDGLGNPQPDVKWTSVLTGYNDCRGAFWENQP